MGMDERRRECGRHEATVNKGCKRRKSKKTGEMDPVKANDKGESHEAEVARRDRI
jgi:hypothetical protein